VDKVREQGLAPALTAKSLRFDIRESRFEPKMKNYLRNPIL